MSDGKQPKGRARGRAWGRARGAPTALQQLQQQQQQAQQQSASPQQPQQAPSLYQQPGPSPQSQQQPRPSARARGHVPKQMQGGASGVQQARQQQDRQQQEHQQQEQGAYGVDPNIQSVSGAFRGLSIGESRPGQALRRGAMRGRIEVVEAPIITKPQHCSVKKGKSGRVFEPMMITNHFRLIKSTNWSLYQYRVDFSPEEERTKVRKALLSAHRDTLGEAYLFDGSMLFCIQKLHPDINTPLELFSARDIDNEVIRITIKFADELALGDYKYIQLFNIILRNCLDNLDFQLVGREYFDPKNSLKLENFRLEIWPGYNTSILQFENNIMMGIDVSHKVLRTDNVLEYLRSCRERHGAKGDAYFLNSMLGAVVFTFYNNKPYRIDDVSFDKRPNDTFTKGNAKISYVEYYKTKYQLTITDLDQPLLLSRPKARDIRGGRDDMIILVPQFCQMTGLTDEMRSNFNLMRAVADRTRVPPNQRVQSYKRFLELLNGSENAMYKLNMWNIQFAPELERVPGRVLNDETLYMADNCSVKPSNGDWSFELRKKSFLNSVRLEKWIVIATKQAIRIKNPRVQGNGIESFLTTLRAAANSLQFEMRRPEVVIIDGDRIHNYLGEIEKAANSGGLQLVMCIINSSRSDLYAAIKKKCIVERPIPSQVIASKTLGHKNLLSVCTKIVIQINCKLGGSPWFTPVPFKEVIKMSDGSISKDSTLYATMVVGFDVCHDTKSKGKSYGALVASLDYNFSRFYSAVSEHGFGEELSNDIATHVSHAVIRFEEINKYYPPKIILFRDGVGESNIKYVREHEIETIKNRLSQLFPNFTIKLTVVIVSKRIQTRFFVENTQKTDTNYSNPPPGTVVDDVVTKPERYDFFLVSQSVRQGTVTPTHYNVIFDDNDLQPDHIQRLAYKMCHLYYNCTATVRVPCQVQYAHKLAFLIGQVIHLDPHTALDHLLYFL